MDSKNKNKDHEAETMGEAPGAPQLIAPFERKPEKKDGSGARKLPSPAPHEGSTVKYISDDEVSSETISIKRSSLLHRDSEKRIELPGEKEKEPPPPEEIPSKRQVKIFCYNCSQKLDLTDLEPFGRIECPSCSSQLIVPKWFDNYLLEEPGGVGGMATVYRALDLTLDREVAIKVLNPDVAVKIERKRLFLHEARTAATLNHYAVLPIYTCGEFEEQPYIVMQFMEGGSLDKKLEQVGAEKIPVTDVIKWISDVAEGLDNARRHGIIHHDIKPANLMLDRDGNVKIGDFGIAQAIRNSDTLTKDIDEITRLWSSPHFVSPEKVSTGKEDHRGDIYSLGATFYNIMTGRTPFELNDINQLVSFKLNNDPPDPRKYRTDIPESIAHLTVAMMARTPDLRPSYRDIITQLTSFVRKSEIMDKKIKQTNKKKSDKIPNMPSRNPPASPAPPESLPSPQTSQYGKSYKTIFILVIAAAIFVFAIRYAIKQNRPDTNETATSVQVQPSTPLSSADYKNYHQDITEMLKKGYCKEASLIAEKRIVDASSPIEARLQAAIQLAFSTYLKNDTNAKNICHIAAEQMSVAGANEFNPLLATVKYLGSSNVSSETLSQISGRPEDKLITSTAIFLKSLYDKSGEIEILKTSKNLGTINQEANPEFWGSAFRDRIRIWQEWINYGSGSPNGLEPLIKDNKYNPKAEIKVKPNNVMKPAGQDPWRSIRMSDADMSNLNTELLVKNRKFASQRPRPSDFEFTEEMGSSYLGSLDKDTAAAETVRLEIVKSIKGNLCACMMRMNYEDNEIILKGGKKLMGSVKANNKYLSVRLKNGNHQRLQWSEIDLMQMVKFLEFFAKIRLEAFGGETDDASQRSYDGAMEYLRIGLLADWYGNYPVAVEYTKKAISLNPRVESEAKKYIMY